MSTKTTPRTIASAITLTTTLSAIGSALNVAQLDAALIHVRYAVGTGGSGIEYDFELSGAVAEPSVDADWYPAEHLSDQSGTAALGVIVAPRSRVVHQIVTAEPRVTHLLDLRGARWLRVRAKETTSGVISAAGTITVTEHGHRN